jgi:hypothetical protein
MIRMNICDSRHRHDPTFETLPLDQGGAGRHRCCGCAYERGYDLGLKREEQLNIDIESLPESQAGTVRHRSPHAAFAMGYQDGVRQSYNQ